MPTTLLALAMLDVLPTPSLGTRLASPMLLGSGLFFYVIIAFSLMRVARRTRMASDAILAWIPILNLVLLVRMAQRPAWWVVLFFIPCIGAITWIVVWLDIAKVLRRSALLGLLAAFVPILGIPVLAFTD